jgi:hypothetical protein
MEAAKQIAAQRVNNPGLLDLLRHWAEDKYNLPWNHDAFQDQTILELLASFWEDYYRKNTLEAKRRPDGEVMFQTGDPLIDKWEQELAMGIEPVLFEGLPADARKRAERSARGVQTLKQRAQNSEVDLDGFSDVYPPSGVPADLPVLGRRSY